MDASRVFVLLVDDNSDDREVAKRAIRKGIADATMPVIMFTNSGTEDVCSQGMKAGLIDYVIKRREPRVQVCELLQRILADEITLYTKTRNYHWNVMGPRFHTLHVFLEEQYQALQEKSDEVAERIRSLGEYAAGSMNEFVELTRLQEQPPGEHPTATQMLARLTDDHEAVVRTLREDIDKCDDEYGDAGTADFLTGLMEDHEKMAWMLRAHLATDAD